MNVRLWLRGWRKFFPKPKARVIDSAALIRALRELHDKERGNVLQQLPVRTK